MKLKSLWPEGTTMINCSLPDYPRPQPPTPIPKLLLATWTRGKETRKSGFQVTLGTRVLAPGSPDRTEEQGRGRVALHHPRPRAHKLETDSHRASSFSCPGYASSSPAELTRLGVAGSWLRPGSLPPAYPSPFLPCSQAAEQGPGRELVTSSERLVPKTLERAGPRRYAPRLALRCTALRRWRWRTSPPGLGPPTRAPARHAPRAAPLGPAQRIPAQPDSWASPASPTSALAGASGHPAEVSTSSGRFRGLGGGLDSACFLSLLPQVGPGSQLGEPREDWAREWGFLYPVPRRQETREALSSLILKIKIGFITKKKKN